MAKPMPVVSAMTGQNSVGGAPATCSTAAAAMENPMYVAQMPWS